jgi:hypothetical protein
VIERLKEEARLKQLRYEASRRKWDRDHPRQPAASEAKGKE